MRKETERESFGSYLAKAIAGRGYPTPTQFARDAGISPAAVSRWINGKERPTMRLLEKAAPALGLDVRTLVAMAYGDSELPPQPTGRPTHTLAADLDRLLAEDGPLDPEQRQRLEIVVEHATEPYRRLLRRRRTSA